MTLTCISGALFLFYAPKILKCPKIILSFLHYLCFNAKIPHRSAGFLPASRLSTRLGAVGGIRTLGRLLTVTRFPVVLVMTTSIPLRISLGSQQHILYPPFPPLSSQNFSNPLNSFWPTPYPCRLSCDILVGCGPVLPVAHPTTLIIR